MFYSQKVLKHNNEIYYNLNKHMYYQIKVQIVNIKNKPYI